MNDIEYIIGIVCIVCMILFIGVCVYAAAPLLTQYLLDPNKDR